MASIGKVEFTPEQIAQIEREYPIRLEVFDKAIQFFKNESFRCYGDTVHFIDDAASILTLEYYAIIYSQWKDWVDDRIDSSKIASSKEMAVVNVVPIVSSALMTVEEINAKFAYHVATFFSMGVSEWTIEPIDFENHDFETRFANIISDHTIMLEGLIGYDIGKQTFPLASNAQYWKLMEFIFSVRKHLKYPLF